MKLKLSIISLGWLGLDVYKNFEQKFDCTGSYFSSKKDVANQFKFDVNSFKNLPSEIKNADLIFFNLPPSSITNLDKLRELVSLINEKRVILISSTSVYEQETLVNESSKILKISNRAKKQAEIEDIVTHELNNLLILRCAGLYSEDRHPGYYLSGKKDISGAKSPVNLVSKKDILDVLDKVLIESEYNLINLVNSNHPTKDDYYNSFCKRMNLDPIEFVSGQETNKTVGTMYPQFKIDSDLP